MPLYAGIEAGGTKFICAIGTGPDDLRKEVSFPTTTPTETIGRTIDYLKEQARQEPLTAIGIATFGPASPDPRSPDFGYITSTPKPNWAQTDLVGPIREALALPVGFDTDVNSAALGEFVWGAAQGLDTLIYLTIGTGLGGGGVINGYMMHGLIHPEMGHIRLPRHPDDDFAGNCPFHGDCLEGMAAGPAIEKRWGQPAESLPPDHPAWEMEAHYLALGLTNFICTLSPQRIILGGGVMEQQQLFPLIRQKVTDLLNGYVQSPYILERIDDYIVPPGLGNQAGVLGAIGLAQQAAAVANFER